jgi:hypothetical protein
MQTSQCSFCTYLALNLEALGGLSGGPTVVWWGVFQREPTHSARRRSTSLPLIKHWTLSGRRQVAVLCFVEGQAAGPLLFSTGSAALGRFGLVSVAAGAEPWGSINSSPVGSGGRSASGQPSTALGLDRFRSTNARSHNESVLSAPAGGPSGAAATGHAVEVEVKVHYGLTKAFGHSILCILTFPSGPRNLAQSLPPNWKGQQIRGLAR